MRLFSIFLLLYSFIFWAACNETIQKDALQGYWQIDKVTQANETFVPATGNIQFDHYTLVATGKGYRKKLSPSLGETLITSRDRSDFTLESQRDSWQLHFQTPWDEWYEKIIRLDSQELVLEHNNKRYYYKRKNLTDGRP